MVLLPQLPKHGRGSLFLLHADWLPYVVFKIKVAFSFLALQNATSHVQEESRTCVRWRPVLAWSLQTAAGDGMMDADTRQN